MIREALLLSLLAGTVPACGFDACGDASESGSGTAPRVESLRLANQLEGDPATLVFAAQFTDADGDLHDGNAQFHLNGATTPEVSFPLSDIFRQSALPADALGGELALTLRLVRAVDDGSSLRLGLRLVDAAGQPSNCYPLEIEFRVAQAAIELERRASALLATLWPNGSDEP